MVADGATARAAGLLVDEAWAAYGEGRFQQAVAAASRAVQAAEVMDDPVLLVRALNVEASSLQLMGDTTAALARYTRILGLAEDSSTRGRLDEPMAAWTVASAYSNWVDAAQYVPGIGVRDLFGVLDAAERWLAVTGHRDWRAGVLLQRALVHNRLGEMDAAVAAAQEALALETQHPDAPGYTLNAYRYNWPPFFVMPGGPWKRRRTVRPCWPTRKLTPWTGGVPMSGWRGVRWGRVMWRPGGGRPGRRCCWPNRWATTRCVSRLRFWRWCRAAGDLPRAPARAQPGWPSWAAAARPRRAARVSARRR